MGMRVFCILISTLALAAHAKDVTETLEEFDNEFNIVENLSDEDIAAEKAALKEAEDEINQINNDADSPFKEALNEFSDLPEEEFLKEKTGVIRTDEDEDDEEMRGTGLIMP